MSRILAHGPRALAELVSVARRALLPVVAALVGVGLDVGIYLLVKAQF